MILGANVKHLELRKGSENHGGIVQQLGRWGNKRKLNNVEAQAHDPKDKDVELQGREIGLVHGPAGFATKNKGN